jgi:hypothetical protein
VRLAISNDDGLYNVPALPPGTYTVKVESSGFQSALHSGVLLQVQETAQIDFTLQPGSVSQTVQVSAAPPQLNTEDSSLGTVVDNQRIVNLPLNGRDFLQLIALSANVTTGFGSPGQATLRQGGSRSTENYSVMGLRGTFNYYSLDGISNTDVNFNLIIMQPSVDALQEFKVQTGIYPAEFGPDQRAHQVRHQSIPRHGIRIPAQ